MIEKINNIAIEEKYNELSSELSKPEVLSDIKKTLELSKEQAFSKRCLRCISKI